MRAGSLLGLTATGVMALSISAFASSAAAGQQTRTPTATGENPTVTMVGCLMGESAYRKAHGLGKGALGGAGLGDEFVLVDAATVNAPAATSSTPPSTSAPSTTSGAASCRETGTGQAYRLTGSAEEAQLKPLLGHWVEITGRFKHEQVGTSGAAPKGKLPEEIELISFHESSAPATTAAEPSRARVGTTGRAPATAARSATPRRPRTSNLPRTASPLPWVGLIGLLALAGALGVRFGTNES